MTVADELGVQAQTSSAAPVESRRWGMFLHLSILAGYMVPLAGLVVPIVIWQMKKDEVPGLDAHGRNAANWIVSHLLYAAGCGLLCIVWIGVPLFAALALCAVLFPIVAAVKAGNGETWKYPLALSFF